MTANDYKKIIESVLDYKIKDGDLPLSKETKYHTRDEINAYNEGYLMGLREAKWTLEKSEFLVV